MTNFYKIVDNSPTGIIKTYYFKHNEDGVWVKYQIDNAWTYYDSEFGNEIFLAVTEDEYNDLIIHEI